MSNFEIHTTSAVSNINSLTLTDSNHLNKFINIYIAKLVLVWWLYWYNFLFSNDWILDWITIEDFHTKLVNQIINNNFWVYQDLLLDIQVLNKILNTPLSDFSNILYDFECKSNVIYFWILDYYSDNCNNDFDEYNNVIYKYYCDLYLENLVSFIDSNELNWVWNILEIEKLYLNNSINDLF